MKFHILLYLTSIFIEYSILFAASKKTCEIAIKNPKYALRQLHKGNLPSNREIDLLQVPKVAEILLWDGNKYDLNEIGLNSAQHLKWHVPQKNNLILLTLDKARNGYVEEDYLQFYHLDSPQHLQKITTEWLTEPDDHFHPPYWIVAKQTGLLAEIGHAKYRAGSKTTYSGGNFKDEDLANLKQLIIGRKQESDALVHQGIFSTSQVLEGAINFISYGFEKEYKNLTLFEVNGSNGIHIGNIASELEVYYPSGALFFVNEKQPTTVPLEENEDHEVPKSGDYEATKYFIEELYYDFKPQRWPKTNLAVKAPAEKFLKEYFAIKPFSLAAHQGYKGFASYGSSDSKISILADELYDQLQVITKYYFNIDAKDAIKPVYRDKLLRFSGVSGHGNYTQNQYIRLAQHPYVKFLADTSPLLLTGNPENKISHELYLPVWNDGTFEKEMKIILKNLANTLVTIQPTDTSPNSLNHAIAALSDFLYLSWGMKPFIKLNEEIFNHFVSHVLFRLRIEHQPIVISNDSRLIKNYTGLRPIEIYYNLIQHWFAGKK